MALSTGLLCVQIGVLNLMSMMATISIFLYSNSGDKTVYTVPMMDSNGAETTTTKKKKQ